MRVSPTSDRCRSVNVFLFHTINSKLASARTAEVEGGGPKSREFEGKKIMWPEHLGVKDVVVYGVGLRPKG